MDVTCILYRYMLPYVHHKRMEFKDFFCHGYYNVEILRKIYNEVVYSTSKVDLLPKEVDVIILPQTFKRVWVD